MQTIAQEPQVYLVPRNGTIESVTVTDHDDLRRLRTELEILRRVARNIRSLRLIPPRENADLHRELFNALQDALHPVVEEAVSLIDSHNPELRKELFMSVVNEEAENIVQEAVDNGVAVRGQTNADSLPPPHHETDAPHDVNQRCDSGEQTPQPPVADALARAQEELADAVQSAVTETAPDPVEKSAARDPCAETEPSCTDQEQIADEPQAETASTESSNAADSPEPPAEESNPNGLPADVEAQLDECISAAAGETGTVDPDMSDDGADTCVDCGSAPNVDDVSAGGETIDAQPDDLQSTQQEPACDTFENQIEPGRSSPASTDSTEPSPFAEYTADKATAAVEEIERGIRKLADLLSNDVNTQWKQAQDAFVEVLEARNKAGTLHQQATRMAREIARLKEEIEIARDDADVVRREARLMREDALHAKQRTEDLASAAKQCADEMQRFQ